MKKISLFLFVMVLIYVPSVLATSGALRKDSIITCNGVTYGQHGSDNHWHVATVNSDGKYYASGEAIYSNPCSNSVSSNSTASSSSSAKTSTSSNVQNNPTQSNSVVTSTKSSDTSIKELKINDDNVNLDDLVYTTTTDNVNINVVLNDEKATAEYEKTISLNEGNNTIIIKVIAENLTEKDYNLIITKNKLLSSNRNIEIKIDGQIVEFTNFESERKYLSYDKSSLNLEYKTEDEKTKVEVNGNDSINVGDSKITIVVTSEDGGFDTYTINVHKYSKNGEIISDIFGFAFLGLTIFLIIKLVKKIKKAIIKHKNK